MEGKVTFSVEEESGVKPAERPLILTGGIIENYLLSYLRVIASSIVYGSGLHIHRFLARYMLPIHENNGRRGVMVRNDLEC